MKSTRNSEELESKIVEAPTSKSKVLKMFEINKPSQFQSLRLPAHVDAHKISRLIYNNAGNAILVLTVIATYILWNWPQNNLNLRGKATTKVPPQLLQPRGSLLLMTNDITETDAEAVACFAVYKNDSFFVSALGGKVSLFNMMTFKILHLPACDCCTSTKAIPVCLGFNRWFGLCHGTMRVRG